MKKIFSAFILLGLFFPVIAEAGFSPEGANRPKKSRCKGSGGVVVCRMPKRKKCTIKRSCVPPKYYRLGPPKFIPMK